jgi:hypothetical protein
LELNEVEDNLQGARTVDSFEHLRGGGYQNSFFLGLQSVLKGEFLPVKGFATTEIRGYYSEEGGSRMN